MRVCFGNLLCGNSIALCDVNLGWCRLVDAGDRLRAAGDSLPPGNGLKIKPNMGKEKMQLIKLAGRGAA